MGLKPCARASEEHRERARRLRELANVAPSRSEQARLNSRAEVFDALARVVEQSAKPNGRRMSAHFKIDTGEPRYN